MHLPEGATAQLLFLGGLGLLIYILMRRSFRFFTRRAEAGAALPRVSQTQSKTNQPLHDAPPELARWQVEMYDTTRAYKAEIDSKLCLLQILVGRAQRESQRLEAALARAEALGLPVRRDALAQIEALASQPVGNTAAAQFRTASDSCLVGSATSGALPGSSEQRRRIYSLADENRPLADIADRVGLPLGEVEMLLGLRTSETSEVIQTFRSV